MKVRVLSLEELEVDGVIVGSVAEGFAGSDIQASLIHTALYDWRDNMIRASIKEAKEREDSLKIRQGERLVSLKAQHRKELKELMDKLEAEQAAHFATKSSLADMIALRDETALELAVVKDEFRSSKLLPRALKVASSNVAALEKGMVPTDFYRTPSGQVMQVY